MMDGQGKQAIIEVDPCPHPDLVMWHQDFTRMFDIQCAICGKHIEFPMKTIVRASREDRYQLILMTFGQYWAERFKRGNYGWPE